VLKITNSDDMHNASDAAPATYSDNCLQNHISNLHAPQTECSAKQAFFGERESQVNDHPQWQNKNDDVEDKIYDRYAPVSGLYGKTIICVEELFLEGSIDWSAL